MAYDPNNPNKYQKQAAEYASCCSSLDSELSVALSELNKVNETLGFTSKESKDIGDGGDTSACKDALTLNVIVSNEEIKSEIKELQQDLTNYTGLITPKAKELDDLEKAEYDAAQKALNESNSSDDTEKKEETQTENII